MFPANSGPALLGRVSEAYPPTVISAVDSGTSSYQAGQALVYILLIILAVSAVTVAVRRRSKQSPNPQLSEDETLEEPSPDAWWRQ